MEIALMIEGQNGLDWDRWQRIAALTEEKGFTGLYRSDHFTNANPPDRSSLECWTSLTWLAAATEGIEFGPLVSPFSFRHPAMLARYAASVSDLSGGRLWLGVGAGWQQREHVHYSFDLLDVKGRLDRMEEGLQIVAHLLRDETPLTFNGRYYELTEAVLLPRPSRPDAVPIVVGGNGERRTLPMAARYADEWNGIFLTPEAFRRKSELLDAAVGEAGREPADVRRTLMTGTVFDLTVDAVKDRLAQRGRSAEDLQAAGVIVGAGDEFLDQLAALAEAGVQRVMLQWLDLDDLERLSGMAELVIPVFHGR